MTSLEAPRMLEPLANNFGTKQPPIGALIENNKKKDKIRLS